MLIFGLFKLGPKELIIVAVAAAFFFGSKKIPELARGIAQGIRELRGTTSNMGESDETGQTS